MRGRRRTNHCNDRDQSVGAMIVGADTAPGGLVATMPHVPLSERPVQGPAEEAIYTRREVTEILLHHGIAGGIV